MTSTLDYLKENRLSVIEFNKTRKGKPSFIDLVKSRIDRNLDCRILMTGEGGIGKSTLSLKIGEHIDSIYLDNPKLAVKNKVCFDTLSYIKAVNREPAGSVIILDEAGQAGHHREYMSGINIILSKTMIGFRFKRFVSILNVPVIDMVDKDCRMLVQFMIFIKKKGNAIVYKTISSRFGGKSRFKKIKDNLEFGKPNVKLWHLYEKKKFKVEDELFKSYEKTLLDKAVKPKSNTEYADEILKNPSQYQKLEKWHIPSMRTLGIGRERAETIRELLKRREVNDNPDI